MKAKEFLGQLPQVPIWAKFTITPEDKNLTMEEVCSHYNDMIMVIETNRIVEHDIHVKESKAIKAMSETIKFLIDKVESLESEIEMLEC